MSKHPDQLSDAQTILDSITDAFFSLNAKWEFSYVNRQTVKTLNCEAGDLLGKCIWEVYPGTVGSEFESNYRKAAQEQQALAFNSYYPDHDRWYDVNVYPTPAGLSVYFRDNTDRMREELRRDALYALSDYLRELGDPDEIIYKASEILGTTLGVSRVGYGSIDLEAETLHVERDWSAPGVKALPGNLKLREYGSFIDDLKAGNFIFIDDVDADSRTASTAHALKARSAASFVNVPVIEKGELVAVIFVNFASARHWLPAELVFIKDVAERTRSASERARNSARLDTLVTDSERRRRLYETFLENSPDLAYVFGLDHRFIYANKVLLAMWGQTWDEAIGKNCLELGYEPWHAAMHDREIDQVIATRQPIRGEVPFNGTNGLRVYEYIFTPVLGLDGEVEAIAGTTRDITERKQAEEGLLAANRRKDEFLAMLAHELRNPLAPIAAAAEVLQMRAFDEQMTQRTSQIITRQVKHMIDLVDDLLDVSRVTRGLVKISKSPLDLKSVVNTAVEQVRPLMEAQGHRLMYDLAAEKAMVMGDQKRLVQIFTNLLNNAAKYTPPHGEIRLGLVVDGDALILSIEDNGIGMSAELQPHVFELFTQADRTTDRTLGGLGIGLALARNLTELHGGTIVCYSAGKALGSTFSVRLPLHDPAAASAEDVGEGNSVDATIIQALRILVVDDNSDAADTLAQLLELLGHRTQVAHGGKAALQAMQDFRPQVVLLDLGMPEVDGYQVAAAIRNDGRLNQPFLAALTGWGSEQDRVKTRAAGFDLHLTKPIDLAVISTVLASINS